MSPPAKVNDVIEALEAAGEEFAHYLDRTTGEIVMTTNEEMKAAEEDELISEYPDWQREAILQAREILRHQEDEADESEDFVALPDQFEIHEYQIMEDFCLAFEDRRVGEDLRRLIKGSGAFRRFKNAIYSMGADKSWHEFRRAELKRIAIGWLEENAIAYSREDAINGTEGIM